MIGFSESDAGLSGRVLFVLDPVRGHVTGRTRGLSYRQTFERRGWSVAYVSRYPHGEAHEAAIRRREQRIAELASSFDVVCLMKVPSLALVREIRRQTAAKIVFDMSDALWMPAHRPHGWSILEQLLACVDAVFCNNECVEEFARRHNPRVFLVPDCVPLERFDRLRNEEHARDRDQVVVGWLGSAGTASALGVIRGPLEAISRRGLNARLRVVGCGEGQIPAFDGVRVSVLPEYGEDDMVREVLSMDIGLFPPPADMEDYRVRGATKALVYMSGGVATICQNAGECARLIRDGDNGMLADTEADWTSKLDALVRSPELRRRMGLRGLETARASYSRTAVFEILQEALREVMAARESSTPARPPRKTMPPLPSVASAALPSGSIGGCKIIVVLEYLQPGGAELQALLLARSLKDRHAASVEVWGFQPPGRVSELCAACGITCRHVPFRWSRRRVEVLANLIRFGWALRAARPDVILAYTRLPSVACGLVWRWTGARLAVWNQRDAGMELTDGRLERRAVDHTPLFLSNSRHAAEMLTWRYAVSPDRVRVVPNGIELAPPRRDRAEWRRALGVPDDAVMATMVANLHRFKDHETLVDAWAQVARELRRWEETEFGRSGQSPPLHQPAEEAGSSALEGRPPCRPPACSSRPPRTRATRAVLVLAGRDGGMTAGLKQRAFDLGLSGDDIRFPGQVDDVPGLLAASDLGVFSSRAEGCPNAVLECMAAGLPVVATDIPGIREAVGEDYEWLAPAGDAGTLARRVLGLIGDPAARRAAADGLKQRAERIFGVQQMADRTAAILAAALADAERKAGAG